MGLVAGLEEGGWACTAELHAIRLGAGLFSVSFPPLSPECQPGDGCYKNIFKLRVDRKGGMD